MVVWWLEGTILVVDWWLNVAEKRGTVMAIEEREDGESFVCYDFYLARNDAKSYLAKFNLL